MGEKSTQNLKPRTIAAQAFSGIEPVTKAVVPPVHVATTFIRDPDNQYRSGYSYGRPDNATVLVTHYYRILTHIRPDFVHVLADGRIVKSGGKELALELEEKGYDWLREAAPVA